MYYIGTHFSGFGQEHRRRVKLTHGYDSEDDGVAISTIVSYEANLRLGKESLTVARISMLDEDIDVSSQMSLYRDAIKVMLLIGKERRSGLAGANPDEHLKFLAHLAYGASL